MLALGWKARWAALAVAVFTLVASIFFHNFWTMADAAAAGTNQIMFMKNVSVIGGMLMVFAFGPGRSASTGADGSFDLPAAETRR